MRGGRLLGDCVGCGFTNSTEPQWWLLAVHATADTAWLGTLGFCDVLIRPTCCCCCCAANETRWIMTYKMDPAAHVGGSGQGCWWPAAVGHAAAAAVLGLLLSVNFPNS